MNLYRILLNSPPKFEDVYEVYVIAADKKHAERLARIVYWNGQKVSLNVEQVDMTQEMIVGFLQWYG